MDYLRFERPPTTNAEVFVRLVAPHDTPISPDAVRKVISNAYHRIGITHGRTHALRHTMARRLLEHGSSLKEVADVLRHRSLNTSLIYAKLDSQESDRCRAAMAWEYDMKAPITMQMRVDNYLAERRRLGFQLRQDGL